MKRHESGSASRIRPAGARIIGPTIYLGPPRGTGLRAARLGVVVVNRNGDEAMDAVGQMT
jgi:hypothetical protein